MQSTITPATPQLSDFFQAVRAAHPFAPQRYKYSLPDAPENVTDRFWWFVACRDIIMPEYRLKWPYMPWWEDEVFTAYLRKFDELKVHNSDRRWDLRQLLRLTANVPGDMAECGVYKGASAQILLEACKTAQRHLYLFDSFEGLSEPNDEKEAYWKKGDMAAHESIMLDNLRDHEGMFTTYKGWIPDRFPEVADTVFACVHIDVDLYGPTLDSMAFFYPRLAPGGLCVCDDYNSSVCPGARRAVDEFLADKPEKMLALSGGSGFFIKNLATA